MIWFFIAGLWLISFSVNLSRSTELDLVIVLQFLNIFLSIGVGIKNTKKYKKKSGETGE